ncbi:hypothetical protein QA802_39155 [Streptomyces sp. B21-105]|uniref:hypothetical protein n=1 Tax=Streptomyces sp. B21-105 TaxID=3039417 RepID=UPI002FF4077E
MADNHDETTSLRPLYAARLAEDLKHNTEEQERLGNEVSALQEKLESLRHDHALLLNMQQALGGAAEAGEAASASAPTASVPRQAAPTAVPAAAQGREQKKKARARKSTSSPKAASSPKAESAPKPAASPKPAAAPASKTSAASKSTPKTESASKTASVSASAAKKAPAAKPAPKAGDGPTLRELVVGHLTGKGEPRSALEVTEALSGAHPERGIKITVVRSTLEALVAKGQVRRSKQGKSVFYSAESVPAADEKQPATV